MNLRSQAGGYESMGANGGSGDHIAELLPAYLNGSLDLLSQRRVQIHLGRCADCRRALATWSVIGEATILSSAADAVPSDGLLGRALAKCDVNPETSSHAEMRRTRSQRPRNGSGLFASLVSKLSGSPLEMASPVLSMTDFDDERTTPMLQPTRALRRTGLVRSAAVVAAAAAVAVAVVATPVGSYAQGFLTIFTPQKVTAVPVTMAEVKSLPDLRNYGTLNQPAEPKSQHVASAAAASAASGMTVLVPGTIPNGVPNNPSYEVMPSQTGSFTFSAAKAQATAKAAGKTLPAMPANIDGSTLQVTSGVGVVAMYQTDLTGPSATGEKTASGATKQETQKVPALIVGQMVAPTVTSTGASASELEQYLLAQPGISPDLANAIRAIGDPTSTLPIPVPVDKASSHPVTVQGVSGLSVADSSGLAGGIIWVKNGVVYGVAGALSESDLLAVANSLH